MDGTNSYVCCHLPELEQLYMKTAVIVAEDTNVYYVLDGDYSHLSGVDPLDDDELEDVLESHTICTLGQFAEAIRQGAKVIECGSCL